MERYRELLSLTAEQRQELTRWTQLRRMPAGDVFRAQLILALADGMTYAAIKGTLHTTAPTISRWKQPFEDFGILGRARLQPHRLERYMASNDPDFEAKAADIAYAKVARPFRCSYSDPTRRIIANPIAGTAH